MVISPPELLKKYPRFTAALATARRGSRNWWRARTGILLLDLVDRLLSRDRLPAASVHQFVAIRRATSAVTPDAVRQTMRSVITLVVDRAAASDVLEAVGEFGKQLNCAGQYRLGYDVYRFMIARARKANASARLPQWYEDLGYCLREDDKWEDATEAYRRGLECADENGDDVARFRLFIAQAHIYREARHWDRAQVLLAAARASAEALGQLDLVVRSNHESAVLAHDCGRLADALAFYRRALQASGYGADTDRHRLILDIARALSDVGHRDEARDAYAVLLTIARERSTRWKSALNLLDLAVGDDDPWLFDHYQTMLARVPMRASLRAFYHRRVAEGSERFGRQTDAEMHRRLAERASRQAKEPESSAPSPEPWCDAMDVATVADLISAVREIAHAPRRRVDSRPRRSPVRSERLRRK